EEDVRDERDRDEEHARPQQPSREVAHHGLKLLLRGVSPDLHGAAETVPQQPLSQPSSRLRKTREAPALAGASQSTSTPSSSLLLDEEGVEVGARVRRLEEVATSPLRHELTLVAVVIRRPRSVVLGDHD